VVATATAAKDLIAFNSKRSFRTPFGLQDDKIDMSLVS
jgi:hypothetical protein